MIEERKEALAPFKKALETFGGPGSGPHKGGGSGGEDDDKEFLDPDKWNKLTTEQQREKGKPAGKGRNGKAIKNGDEVHYRLGNHTSSSPGGVVVNKDPNTGFVMIRDYNWGLKAVKPEDVSTEPFSTK